MPSPSPKKPAAPTPAPMPTPTDASKWSVDDAIEALLEALNLEPATVRSLEIRANGVIRISTRDNTFRSVKFTALPEPRKVDYR